MSKESTGEIIEKDHHEGESDGHTENHNHDEAVSHQETEHENAGHESAEENVLQKVLGSLGDHRDFTIFNKELFELPVIMIDEGSLKTYSGITSMEESGDYLYEHHHIVNAKTQKAPTLDLSITNLAAFEFIAAFLMIIVFVKVGLTYKKNKIKAPRGLAHIVEVFVLMVRDNIVRPNIPSRVWADRLTPYFLVTFFFIYFLNMVGLLPGGHTPTGSMSITLGLAIIAFVVINVSQIRKEGIKAYVAHLTAGSPWYLWPILIPIELSGLFIKPGVLAIRLFANMTAGHMVLFTFLGLILLFESFFASVPFLGFSLFVYVLELLVAFLQAFIFTMLTAIFVGLGMHSDGQHAH
jgi:F-type H+-transporting ATPase subunit a